MFRRTIVRIALLSVLITVLALSSGTLASAGTGHGDRHSTGIVGTVVSGVDGTPIANADVAAFVWNAKRGVFTLVAEVYTDASGTFTFDVAQGVYYIGVQAPGYRTEFYQEALDLGTAEGVWLLRNQIKTLNPIALAPTL